MDGSILHIDVVGRRHLSIDNYVHTHNCTSYNFRAATTGIIFVSATYSQNTSITFLTFGKKLHIFVSSDSQCFIDSGISSHSFWWHKETGVSFRRDKVNLHVHISTPPTFGPILEGNEPQCKILPLPSSPHS